MFTLSSSYNYNQKEVIETFVLSFISSHKIKSMLDIGAGFTKTAKSFQNTVTDYLAIEQDKMKSKELEKEGVSVLNAKFPCGLEKSYQLILASHSIPEKIKDYKAFFEKAWEAVEPGGWLVVITFKGANDALVKFKCELVGECEKFDEDKYSAMIKILNGFGHPVVEKIVSVEKTTDVNDLVQIICWSLKINIKKWAEDIKIKLMAEFFKDDAFLFPHEHNVIYIQK